MTGDATIRAGVSLWRRLSPPQLLAGSFATLILVGTLCLRLIPGLYTQQPINWLDALFTATSAVCVTGLIVVDTATYFTPTGQALILLLIQLGGLGIITFTTAIIVAVGGRLSLRHEALVSGISDVAPDVDYRALVRHVLVFTAVFEILGAVLLYALWLPRFGWQGAAWPALFHSISAFCNAGFSVFSDSLMAFQQSPMVQVVVMLLIVSGGVGFLALHELYLERKVPTGKRSRLSIHTRLVVTTTCGLVLVGWLLLTTFEWSGTLAELPIWSRIVNGLFASVTARTAGFNTVDYAAAAESTNFLTILLMFVGGSPGSMAGGIKTTTFALVGLLAWSRLRGRSETAIWNRSVPPETVQRAVGVVVVSFGLVTAGIFVLTTTEASASTSGSFLSHMFEATSAFGTVGLSMGTTPTLSTAGRWTIIILMFIGRVGPLTIAAAMARRVRILPGGFRDAYEDVAIA